MTLAQTPPAPTTSPTTATAGLQFPSILLSVIVFVTFVAFVAVLFFPERNDEDRSRIRVVALAAAATSFFLAAFFGLLVQIGIPGGGGQSSANEENYHWLAFSFVSNFHLTADGMSLTLLALTSLVFMCVFVHAWKVRERLRLYVGLLLLLETAVNGVLCSADYVLFLLFWGMQIGPLYLLLRIWGGPQRLQAASRYLGFALVSFVLMLVAILLVIVKAGQHSSDIATDYMQLLAPVEVAGFWLTLAAFTIALGAFPAHRWMVASVSEAAPGVAAAMSGAVLGLGGYGLMRITLATFPHAAKQFSLVIVALAVIGAVWGAAATLAQQDVRRALGYVNATQVALVLLAVGTRTSIALVGAVLLLVARGLGTAMLALLAGSVEERTRTRSLHGLGGLAHQAPRLTALWLFAVFTLIGVPLLAGFAADFVLFSGAFPVHRVATTLSVGVLVLSGGGLVWLGHRMFLGRAQDSLNRVRDVSALELTYLLPLVAAVLLFGLRPGAVTPVITNGVVPITTALTGS